MWEYNYSELYHHGIKGMHWGIRRYQNKDGSLTAEGKKRYGTYETWKNDELYYKRAAYDGRVDDPELLELLTMEAEEHSRYRDKLIADGEEYVKTILDKLDSNAVSYNPGSEKYADIKDFSKIRDLGIQESEKKRK